MRSVDLDSLTQSKNGEACGCGLRQYKTAKGQVERYEKVLREIRDWLSNVEHWEYDEGEIVEDAGAFVQKIEAALNGETP